MSKMKQKKLSKQKKENKTSSSSVPKKNAEKREPPVEEQFTNSKDEHALASDSGEYVSRNPSEVSAISAISNVSDISDVAGVADAADAADAADVSSSKVVDKKKNVTTSSAADKKVHPDLERNENFALSTQNCDSGNFENLLKNADFFDSSDYSSSDNISGISRIFSNLTSPSKKHVQEVFAFVYNFLREQSFFDSMAAFEKEYAEKFEDIENLKKTKCRNLFAQNALLRTEINTQSEFRTIAEGNLQSAQLQVIQLQKERDNHLMHRKRAEQEKTALYKEMQRQKMEMHILQKAVDAHKSKCEILRKEKVLIMLEKDKCSSKIEGMNNYINRLKQLLGCYDENESGDTSTIQGDIISSYSEYSGSQGRRGLYENSADSTVTTKTEDTPWPEDDSESVYDFPIHEVIAEDTPGFISVSHLKDVNHFTGHNNAVAGMDFNFKINMLATASDDGTWKTWTGSDGELIMSSPNQNSWIGSVCFHPDGKILCTAGGDSKVKLWHLEKEICVHTFKQHTGPVWNLSFHREGNFLASCSMDQTVRIFDMNTLKQRQILRGHTDSVNSVKFHPSSNMLATASVDRTISIWDMRSGLCRTTFYGHDFPCNDVSYNCVTNWLISCDCGGIVKIWDIRTNHCLLSLDVGPVSANKCATDTLGDLLYVASDDTMLKIFDFQKKGFVQSFHHKAPVKSVIIGTDSIYTGLDNGDIHIWGP